MDHASSPSHRPTPHPAEEYELTSPVAGPSSSPHSATRAARRSSNPTQRRAARGSRTLTLHPNDTSALLFSAPSSAVPQSATTPTSGPLRTHRRTVSLQGSPVGSPKRGAWANFLDEGDVTPHFEHAIDTGQMGQGGPGPSGRTEQVTVPDFGHMLGFNIDDEDHYAVARSMESGWKKRLYLLMEEPRSGREAFYVHVFVTGAILFSAVLTTLSTLPTFHLHPTSIRLLFGLDTTLIVLFTVEYLARSLAHSDSWAQYWSWATSFFPILDLLAILPYYIEVAREEDTSILFRFSILRVFRLLRVFRAFKYQNQMLLTIEVMYVAVQRSKDALVAISFFILLVLVLFSTLIYFAERGTWDSTVGAFLDADGDPSQFDSIPQTAWFALVTMSTVGYGDVVPRSFFGKLLTMPLLLFGLLLIALPSFVLGRNFAIVFDAMTHQINQIASTTASPRASFEAPPSPMPPLPPSLTSTIRPDSHPAQFPFPSHPAQHAAKYHTKAHADVESAKSPLLGDVGSAEMVEETSASRWGRDKSYPPKLAAQHAARGNPVPSSGSKGDSIGLGLSASSTGSASASAVQGKNMAAGPSGYKWNALASNGHSGTASRSSPIPGQTPDLERKERERSERDLTNVKLAKNQLVLLDEIRSLHRTIDRQGQMIASLLGLLEGRAAAGGIAVNGSAGRIDDVSTGHALASISGSAPAVDEGGGRSIGVQRQGNDFAVGSSDDE